MDTSGTGWGITSGLNPEMVLLAEHLLKLPPHGQADQDRALPGGSVPPATFLPIPWVPSVYSHQGGHKWQRHEASVSSRSSFRASVMGSGIRTTPTSSTSVPPKPMRWPSWSMAGSCRSSTQRCTWHPISLTSRKHSPQARMWQRRSAWRRSPLPGQLQCRHQRDVYQYRTQLQGVDVPRVGTTRSPVPQHAATCRNRQTWITVNQADDPWPA